LIQNYKPHLTKLAYYKHGNREMFGNLRGMTSVDDTKDLDMHNKFSLRPKFGFMNLTLRMRIISISNTMTE